MDKEKLKKALQEILQDIKRFPAPCKKRAPQTVALELQSIQEIYD